VVINSGNANACTGERGLEDAQWMAAEIAQKLGCSAEDVLVCSTGVIGQFLPREKLAAGLPAVVEKLADTPEAFADAAGGMMTTDTFAKQAIRQAELAGRTVRVSGAAKGAAMIGPNLATMLSVIMTDADLTADAADGMLRRAVEQSFNCISVEGHTSTSDSVILLANGGSETGPLSDADSAMLQRMFDEVAEELAKAIIRDAEGADHFITIDVRGLRTREEARRIAKTVAEGALVKTAVTGADPNWGRIVSAVGYAGVDLQEADITLRINETLVYQAGSPVEYDERAVSESMRSSRDVHIVLEFSLGDAGICYWTSDLTAEYVRLNSEYTT
jgi:glutamate N-acetyltransferase/amino-acid N-acetyltransferase